MFCLQYQKIIKWLGCVGVYMYSLYMRCVCVYAFSVSWFRIVAGSIAQVKGCWNGARRTSLLFPALTLTIGLTVRSQQSESLGFSFLTEQRKHSVTLCPSLSRAESMVTISGERRRCPGNQHYDNIMKLNNFPLQIWNYCYSYFNI